MIIGNLGRDPEMRYTPSGTAVTQFSVAVNRNTRDEAGEWKKETEWFRVVLFREQAERAAEWLRKGAKVYVEGRIQTRQYEKDGQTHYMTELVAERFANLDPRQRDEEGGDEAPAARPGGPAPPRPAGPERRPPRSPPVTRAKKRDEYYRDRRRRKVCSFCADKTDQIDYKEVNRLRRYLSERAKIEPRRKTGTCAQHQRQLSVALKRARIVALLPYAPQHLRP